MKKLFKLCLTAVVALSAFAVSCQKYDDSELRDKISGLEDRVSSIESMITTANNNIDGLKTIVASLNGRVYATSVKELPDGYQITFSDGNTVTIKNGVSPVIGVRKDDEDGLFYWTLNGDWLLDKDGKKMPVTGPAGVDGKDGVDGVNGKDGVDGKDGKDGTDGKDGVDGKDGADAIAPKLKIEGDYWYISTDGGITWEQLQKAKGEDGDAFIVAMDQDELNVYLLFKDGTMIAIPFCDVESLLTRIQSIVYVPDYDDCKITVNAALVKYGNQAVLMDQPTEITYQVLPASLASVLADNIWKWNYMNPDAVDFWDYLNYFFELDLPDLDKISGQDFRNFLKEDGIKDIFAWFDVRPVKTRTGDENTEKYSLKIMDVVKADDTTGEITFKVMPVNIASESFAAAGLKPQEEIDNYSGVRFVYNYDELKAYQNRTAFAVQLRLYQLQDFELTGTDENGDHTYKDYENELASTYTGLYPNILDPIELLPGAFIPDSNGGFVSADGLNNEQTLPYNVFRKDGNVEEPGYRVIMDGLTPAFIIGGQTVSAKEAYKLGYMLPGYEFKADVVKNGPVDDAVKVFENADGLIVVEMDPDASEEVRKAAVGGSVEGKYTLKTPFWMIECSGTVTITDIDSSQALEGYDFLHYANCTFNIDVADFDANDGSVVWWTQCSPNYYSEPLDATSDGFGRPTFLHALADYRMMPINLLTLGFNVVDGEDKVLTEDEIKAAGLEVQFEYTDNTLGEQELPACAQEGKYLYYNDLWLDKTTFFYQPCEKPFIPMRARLFLNTGEGKKELPTRFSNPKASVANPSQILDYSAYALAAWDTFSEFTGEDIYISLNQHTIYRESLAQSIFLMDNRPGGICYSVIDSGQWVTGNVSWYDATNGICPPECNGYLEGISSKDAYHITSELVFDLSGLTNEVPKALKKKISVVYSSDGLNFYDDPEDGRIPYIQFDNTAETTLYGFVEIPVHVELPNPWQPLATDFMVILQGQQ